MPVYSTDCSFSCRQKFHDKMRFIQIRHDRLDIEEFSFGSIVVDEWKINTGAKCMLCFKRELEFCHHLRD